MPVKSITVMNMMVFQNQWRFNNGMPQEYNLKEKGHFNEEFQLSFTDGINVIIGENGTGKTTLLKMIYAATQWSNEKTHSNKTDRFSKFFSNYIKDTDLLKNHNSKQIQSGFIVSDGTTEFEYCLSPEKGFRNLDNWIKLNIQSVYIPTTEMLSHAKGFLALNEKYDMPFDGTQIDIIVNASLPETRELPSYASNLLDLIGKAIGGTVIYENDSFYVIKYDGQKIDFSLEAEGLRKLALLWKLIRNGLLEKDSILLWDEPESNLNPELFPLVAEILLLLQRNGIQIFVATHSYNFAKYLEITKEENDKVQFHTLYKGTPKLSTSLKNMLSKIEPVCETVFSDSADKLEDLSPNHLMSADEKLLDMVFEQRVSEK